MYLFRNGWRVRGGVKVGPFEVRLSMDQLPKQRREFTASVGWWKSQTLLCSLTVWFYQAELQFYRK